MNGPKHVIHADDAGELRILLDHLGRDLEPSILIGGWATHLRVGGEISHDIDLILGDDSVRDKLRARLDDLSTSSHIGGVKWRGTVEGVHLDIYIPHESTLGEVLRLRVEILARHVENRSDPAQRWSLLTIEAHTVSKLAALLDRSATVKGTKDANELLRLLRAGVDPDVAAAVLVEATAGPRDLLESRVDSAFRLIAERGSTNKQDRRWLERLRRQWVDATVLAVRSAGPGNRPNPQLNEQ